MTLTLSEPLQVKAQTAKQQEVEYNQEKEEKEKADYNRQKTDRLLKSKFEALK